MQRHMMTEMTETSKNTKEPHPNNLKLHLKQLKNAGVNAGVYFIRAASRPSP